MIKSFRHFNVVMALWAGLLLALPAAASTTVLTGTIRDSTGSLFNGKFTFTLPVSARDTTTNSAVIPRPVDCPVVNGAFLANRCVLVDNNTLEPTNTFYIVEKRDSFGELLAVDPYVITGATMDFGLASPTAVTTSNITYLNPALRGDFTAVLKKGSGSGGYSFNSNTNYADVDGTNLSYTVTIPTGWKLSVVASGNVSQNTAATGISVALVDGSTLVESTPGIITAAAWSQFSLGYIINGNGASHTIKLQYKTTNTSNAVTMQNSSTLIPTMVFTLLPSN